VVFRHDSEPPAMAVGSVGSVRSICQVYVLVVEPPEPDTLTAKVCDPAARPL